MKHIAITGYNSFIANNFYKKFKNKFKISKFKKDINNHSEFEKFINKNKVTHIIHFAGLSRYSCEKNKTNCLKTNYKSIKNIVFILNKLKKKPFFIFISTSHVYKHSNKKLKETSIKQPKSLYAKLKLKSELFIKKNYHNATILRLFNVYGKKQPVNYFVPDILNKIQNNKIIKIDRSIRDFIKVDEVSEIIHFVIKKKLRKTINVGSGMGLNLIEMINILANIKNKKPKLQISNSRTNLVADISLLKTYGYNLKYNAKNINF